MENPGNLRYIEDHEWVKIDGETATIGITDYAQKQLSDIVYVELPEVGKKIEQNESLGVVESMKSVSDICSPVSGTVLEVNKALEKTPELVNNEPYEGGWIVKLEISDKSEIESLMTSEEYDKFIE